MKNNIFIWLFLALLTYSCCSPKFYILPKGNLDLVRQSNPNDSINSAFDEIAPYQRVLETNCIDAYRKENSNLYIEPATSRIKPSNSFFRDLLGDDFVTKNKRIIDFLTKQLESVSFLTNNSGFVSLAHGPDANYTRIMELPFVGYVGGTDIYFFQQENGRYVFRSIPEPINSVFWDSHPWVGTDSLCNLVLIWASDRDNPYSIVTSLDKQIIKKGNSDIFYAFRIDGVWSVPQKFDRSSLINTDEYNEITPFVACSKISPKLLFASNRDKDYDIYEADIEIDFKSQTIRPIGTARQLPKSSQFDFENQFINTNADEMFPLVAFPYYNETQKELFISSNRNITPKPLKSKSDTLVANKGKFDIYMFPYSLECKEPPPPPPPVATINVRGVNKKNPSHRGFLPIIKLVDLTTGQSQEKNAYEASFNLINGHRYEVWGGSAHNTLDCGDPGQAKILKYYKYNEIFYTVPKIVSKDKIIEYDTIINPTPKFVYDTLYVTELIPITLVDSIRVEKEFVPHSDDNQSQKKETITNIRYVRCPPRNVKPVEPEVIQKSEVRPELTTEIITQTRTSLVEVTKQVINKRLVFEGGRVQKKTLKLIEYDTIPQLDSTDKIVIGPLARSQKTMLKPIDLHFERDTVINDEILLEPEYFEKPKCSVKFVDILDDYYKNVPYYQTAFWEVNTSANLPRHILLMQRGNPLENATCIELHPRNTRYGVWTGVNRETRMNEYRKYAQAVDRNLLGMKTEITDHFIPALEEISKLSPETKLIIKLEAYSDIRDAGLCNYFGETVSYIQGKINDNSQIVLDRVVIRNGDNLNSDNDNLSKLRVYYGYNELMALLRKDERFRKYLNEGLVFLPTQKFDSPDKMYEALRNAKIIIIAEGKKFDPVIKENDKEYDAIRRLNLFIQLIKFSDKFVISADCCTDR
ncbi:MAG TPA: hypothetical protein PLU67_01210 [Candidatus Kapabacteria bacterium]|nr:hypothetical protein [Candidatus Kapabacteria bacterium]